MNVEVEIPNKHAGKLGEVNSVEPTLEEQIEVAVLSQVLGFVNDARGQSEQEHGGRLVDPDNGAD